AGLDVECEILLADGKPHERGVGGWTVHPVWPRKGLRWYVTPLVWPRAIRRVWATRPFDLLRAHSVRYVGPAALPARRRYRPLIERKNPRWLLDVFAEIRRTAGDDVKLVWVGKGPLRGELEAQAARLGLAGAVVFTGYLPEADKVAMLNLADVFVFPSMLEG